MNILEDLFRILDDPAVLDMHTTNSSVLSIMVSYIKAF
ncbi:hypothetical protein AVEN_253960-1, partial [Araneus ventricosus]